MPLGCFMFDKTITNKNLFLNTAVLNLILSPECLQPKSISAPLAILPTCVSTNFDSLPQVCKILRRWRHMCASGLTWKHCYHNNGARISILWAHLYTISYNQTLILTPSAIIKPIFTLSAIIRLIFTLSAIIRQGHSWGGALSRKYICCKLM